MNVTQRGMDDQPSTPQKSAESEPIVDSPLQNTRSGLNKSKPIAIVTANIQNQQFGCSAGSFKLNKNTRTEKYFEVGTKKNLTWQIQWEAGDLQCSVVLEESL